MSAPKDRLRPSLNSSPLSQIGVQTDGHGEHDNITPTSIGSFVEQQQQHRYPLRGTSSSRITSGGSGWRSFFRSPDTAEGSASRSTSLTNNDQTFSSPLSHRERFRERHGNDDEEDRDELEDSDEVGHDTAGTELEETQTDVPVQMQTQTLDPSLLNTNVADTLKREQADEMDIGMDVFGSSKLDKQVMLFPDSPTRTTDLELERETGFAGPARGLKGRASHRILTRPSGLGSNGLSKKDFDSQETIVPSDYHRQHMLQQTSSHLIGTSGSASTSRIWEPVDWENFSPHEEEVPTVHEGSMMLLPPPSSSPPSISSPRHRPKPLENLSMRSTLGTRVGSEVYWNLFDGVPRYDQGPLSASTNSNSATSTTVDTSFSGTASTSTPASASASDGQHGIATNHLIQGFTGFTLPGMNTLSSDPEYDSDEAGGSSLMPLGNTQRPGSSGSAAYLSTFADVPIANTAARAGPIEIVVDDEGVAGMTEGSEEGRTSVTGPIRSTRRSTRERRAVESVVYPSTAESSTRPAKRAKRTKVAGPANKNNNHNEKHDSNNALLKPARPPGDRGQGRKPSSALASPEEPDSPMGNGNELRDPEEIAAKKARRREINRKSARTLREKRKAELESAWAVVDQLRDQVRVLTDEVRREREWRVVMQNELVNVSRVSVSSAHSR